MRLGLIGTIAASLLLAGCAAEQQNVQGREDMLAAAGFTLRPADTPARQTGLRTLPPHIVLVQTSNSKPVYLYSDPTLCDCLYIGSEPAYQQYRRMVAGQPGAADQQAAAQAMRLDGWNWGAWGPGWW